MEARVVVMETKHRKVTAPNNQLSEAVNPVLYWYLALSKTSSVGNRESW